MGKANVPPAGSLNSARRHMSFTRESGDPQLALSLEASDEHRREAEQAQSRGEGLGKSDGFVVPEKPANEAQAAELVEERDPAKGKSDQGDPHRTLGRKLLGQHNWDGSVGEHEETRAHQPLT